MNMTSEAKKLTHETIMDHLDTIPQVQGYRVMVIPVTHQEKTKSGIILPEEVRDNQRNHALIFRVVSCGPEAYGDKQRFPSGPYCVPGDYVLIARYVGTRIATQYCEDLRVLNDDEIMAVVPDLGSALVLA
jgi:co-chaperonin GroES (HSP10)